MLVTVLILSASPSLLFLSLPLENANLCSGNKGRRGVLYPSGQVRESVLYSLPGEEGAARPTLLGSQERVLTARITGEWKSGAVLCDL